MTETSEFARAMAAQAAADEAAAFDELHALELEAEQASRALADQLRDRLAEIRQRKQAGARFDPDELDDTPAPAVPPARSGQSADRVAGHASEDDPDTDEEPRRWLT